MDHTGEMDHTVELHHAARFHCGSYHELDIDGASSRPQLAGREVAFYTNRHYNLERSVSSKQLPPRRVVDHEGTFLHQWFYFQQLVSLPGDLVELGTLCWTPPLG